jgi:phage terminase small subunit
MKKKLTDKQRLWAEYYIQTGNATLSAKFAGYKGNNNALGVVGHRNLRNAKIQTFLSKRYQEVAMASDEVMARLAKKARANVSDFVDEQGLIDWEKVHQSGDVIKSITHTKGKQSKIELESSLRALELIGKYHALFTDKVQLEASTELIALMREFQITDDDIRSDPLLYQLFVAAGIDLAGISEDRTARREKGI